ncbi:NADH pyrophosphatase [Iodidimonas nitroreducens]|uniref:NAD(+) diphosphatase n=1 Tax=Iodidimonas nitroreducens TaxID=1236968 RepID=A0A5A7N674_9PROT|nr:NAD(+) diphosphatase [Iodidimonas nitroreducens]GAK34723.1 peroxisomal NADH pyrophosphatase NUDT12 [alpha proteobacterium Q-1]GER02579.1 NADH pyrophosphatase [Iodidimonas nitroreducens]
MKSASLYRPDLRIAYCGNPLDRCENRRGDEHWLQDASQRGRFLAVRAGKIAVHAGPPLRLCLFDQAQIAPLIKAGADIVFLGVDPDQTPLFAIRAPDDWALPDAMAKATPPAFFIDGRSLALQLSDPRNDQGTSGTAAQALAILAWHRHHRFCARCGAPTESRRGGYQRWCAACETEHYPRTDPVAIMLAVRGDHCLMGRQPGFPAGMYSALAGFVESGESLEAAVRREVHEEAGITIGGVQYIGSQPWPFPSNLMLGFLAEALDDQIVMDREELEDVRWFHRDEVTASLAGTNPSLVLPQSIAIAYHLLRRWLDER